jgi:uncharacterized protein (DUF302 family)
MKQNTLTKSAAVFAFALLLASSPVSVNRAFAENNGPVTVQSKASFDQTIDELKQLVAKNGMMVLSELNQGKVMAMTGLKLNAISLFVGNPTIGKKLFAADHGVGVAVPVRVNVYENEDGTTYINYVKPSEQLASFKNKEIGMIAQMLDQKLEALTGMLAK